MESPNQKVGAFPNADQPNQFGTFYRDFFIAWKSKGNMEPDFYGAYGIAKANQDQEFQKVSDEIPWEDLGPKEMVAVMHAAWALAVRLSWFTYKEPPEMAILLP